MVCFSCQEEVTDSDDNMVWGPLAKVHDAWCSGCIEQWRWSYQESRVG